MSKPFTYIYNESLSQGIVPNILKISKVTPVFKSDLTTDPSNYRHQFGFRKNHSTELAILEISDNLKNSIDNKLIICGLFLDFSKAFDTVNQAWNIVTEIIQIWNTLLGFGLV